MQQNLQIWTSYFKTFLGEKAPRLPYWEKLRQHTHSSSPTIKPLASPLRTPGQSLATPTQRPTYTCCDLALRMECRQHCISRPTSNVIVAVVVMATDGYAQHDTDIASPPVCLSVCLSVRLSQSRVAIVLKYWKDRKSNHRWLVTCRLFYMPCKMPPYYLARSANLPERLYILLALSSFCYLFFSIIARRTIISGAAVYPIFAIFSIMFKSNTL